ncbi:MAG: crossover junction endodeoxyribonuclease RuvC [Candidatus Omnitrophica bacterium]|nr:crossover junction endodeoxyribonuclease RuvC [Candidatus Omnitrophota bacterium]
MRILGIDPALTVTGFSIIESTKNKQTLLCAGTIKTEYKETFARRLLLLYEEAIKIIKQFRPDIMVIEKVYVHYRHPTTAFILGHARGVFLLAAASCGIKIEELPATRVKKAIVGKGLASKQQIKRMISCQFRSLPCEYSEDASDALALAVAYNNITSRKHIFNI